MGVDAMTPRNRMRSRCRDAASIAAAVATLITGCSHAPRNSSSGVDLAKLDVGSYSTAPRTVHDQPSPQDGTLLEGIRMAEAVADTSQFEPLLVYRWQADPVPDTASLVPLLSQAGKDVLDRYGWLAGYRVSYADHPQLPNGANPPSYIGLAIMLLRFPDEAAAGGAASALQSSNWKNVNLTVAEPLPKHPDVTARYTPGTGALLADTAIGPFVVHLMLDTPPTDLQTHVTILDEAVDAERTLLANFHPTPPPDIPALPRDPEHLLARMVTSDPAHPPPVSPTFAVYGPVGALRDQLPKIRKDKLYQKWGVDRLAVSGDQHLYRLRDHQAALDMMGELTTEFASLQHEIPADPKMPDEHCFQTNNPSAGMPAFACRIVFNNFYTLLPADTPSSAKQKAAAQYVLLAHNS
jgi:hypothetical protein